jgi:hypothetical protein
MHSLPFPPLPADTLRVTRSIFHIENLYLSIGDDLDALVGDINWAHLDAFGDRPASHLFLLAMVTAFQFAEELSDQAAAAAVRERMDWKYALHLSLDHPGLNPAELREFRRRLWRDPAGWELFRRLLARLAQRGLFGTGSTSHIPAANLLVAIDTRNRVAEMAATMRLALENLAATYPAWLQANGLPHWVERYGPHGVATPQPHSQAEQQDLLDALAVDIAYLLGSIASGGPPDLAQWPEIQALQALVNKESKKRHGHRNA